jgi:uncharacterized membrane protein
VSGVEQEKGRASGPSAVGGLQGGAHSSSGLSRLLLAGLFVAIGLLVAGAVLAAVQGPGSVLTVTSITDLPRLLAAGDATGYLSLGLLVLLATPFARAVALGVDFARRRLWLFAGLATITVAVLVLSGLLGLL